MILNINTDAVVAFTAKLEKLHRSALPVAVRTALNSAAFDVKTETMPASADRTFIKRQANFFKANSKVEQAKGFDMKSMAAKVGFVPFSGTNKAVDDLEQQEYGGGIDGRSFIALAQARTGRSWKRKPRAPYRMAQVLSNTVNAKDAKGKTEAEKFTKSAIHAGKGGFVIGNLVTSKGNKVVFEIRSVKRLKGGDTVIRSIPVFAVQRDRVVRPPATGFMRKSSLESASKIEEFYIEAAKKQIRKYTTG